MIALAASCYAYSSPPKATAANSAADHTSLAGAGSGAAETPDLNPKRPAADTVATKDTVATAGTDIFSAKGAADGAVEEGEPADGSPSAGVQKDEKTNGIFRRLFNDMLFVNIRESSGRNKQIIDEAEQLSRFNGKAINSISYDRHDIFEDKSTWLRSLANGMHLHTVERAIARDLLFGVGDRFDSETAVASNRLIQSRPYISDSWLKVEVNPDDTTRVDITVVTLDNWTIGVEGELFSGSRAMAHIYDFNFLGMGSKVGVRSYLRYSDFRHGGSIVEYENPNFVGTFYTAKLRFGHNFDNTYNEAVLSKVFIRPNDYEAGVAFADNKSTNFKIFEPDTLTRHTVNYRTGDIWGGRSYYIPALKSSFYLTGHYSYRRFPVRPEETAARMHPQFHDRDEVLFGTGFYWERFYSSSMIYGYGFQEYIASGQKLQLIGGYSWQEFGDYWYAGFSTRKGGFTPLGYLMFGVSAGSYISVDGGNLWQSALNINTLWFSNLWGKRGLKIRQFITTNYTRGWNRGEGAGALVRFTDEVCPTSFDTYAAGSSRLVVNTETVFFTPLKPLGFRIAFFGFADAGWIGNDKNPFGNDFFSTFGIGVRFKNERLVFSAFQLRLGFAVGRNGFISNQRFHGSVEQRFGQFRFIPGRPEHVAYE